VATVDLSADQVKLGFQLEISRILTDIPYFITLLRGAFKGSAKLNYISLIALLFTCFLSAIFLV